MSSRMIVSFLPFYLESFLSSWSLCFSISPQRVGFEIILCGCASGSLTSLLSGCNECTWPLIRGRLVHSPLLSMWTLTKVCLISLPMWSHQLPHYSKVLHALTFLFSYYYFKWPQYYCHKDTAFKRKRILLYIFFSY